MTPLSFARPVALILLGLSLVALCRRPPRPSSGPGAPARMDPARVHELGPGIWLGP